MHIDPQDIWSDIEKIRKSSPLIHNITNYVVMEQTANSLLALGASPVMAHAKEEVEQMAMLASSLVLNIGTLSAEWINSMILALKAANKKIIPVVLDPVGAGATAYRTETALSLLNHGLITTIRGNASEIVSLAGIKGETKGVDSRLDVSYYVPEAKNLASKHHCIVWMSGKIDHITDGKYIILIHHGDAMMGKITGMGCTASAMTGAFLAINSNPFLASAHAAVVMGIAGEIAAKKSEGPGSFKLAFMDALYNLSEKEIRERLCVEIY